ncbi:MAG: helix-turn-helix domain-containing protein [Acidobacteria bacterium]|nr:helix-turn-helix domain-containing protein [Acidobacteriota bacterium]
MPLCQLTIRALRPVAGYPQSQNGVGEHLRKRRTELGLRQKDVAQEMEISAWTLVNWESGETTPRVRYGPRIIDFLGFDPLPDPANFGQEVWKLRWTRGLTQRQLAALLGVDESTVRDWERGEHQATVRLFRRFLDLALR